MNELTISKHNIKERIFNFRNSQVMLDRDLAELYHVETKVLNQAVKRNIKRFPNAFRFQLSEEEKTELVTNCDRFSALKHSSSLPYRPIVIKPFRDAHDRFMIIDKREVYHIGASLKDLGKKWFAFSKFDRDTLSILERLK